MTTYHKKESNQNMAVAFFPSICNGYIVMTLMGFSSGICSTIGIYCQYLHKDCVHGEVGTETRQGFKRSAYS